MRGMSIGRRVALLIVVLAMAGCRDRQAARDTSIDHELLLLNGCEFEVVQVDPKRADLNLFWRKPDGSRFANFRGLRTALERSHRRLIFATNAGMYDPNFVPCGLHVEDGHELVPLNLKPGPGNFYMKPNGVFLIDATGPKVIESEKYLGTRPDVRLATQSGPLLVIDGAINAQFELQSPNKRIRSGVGVAADHRVVFAISREPVTFHAFATLFRDRLDCPNALYLDGVVSRFYPASAAHADASDEVFAGMLVVSARE